VPDVSPPQTPERESDRDDALVDERRRPAVVVPIVMRAGRPEQFELARARAARAAEMNEGDVREIESLSFPPVESIAVVQILVVGCERLVEEAEAADLVTAQQPARSPDRLALAWSGQVHEILLAKLAHDAVAVPEPRDA
jgi:hypothetical protein